MRIKTTPTVALELSYDEHVALMTDGGFNHFVGFDPRTLTVRWHQRTPGDVNDPHGERDVIQTGEERGTLWRALLSSDYFEFFMGHVRNPSAFVEVLS